MASNNLRVVYHNIVNNSTSTVTASSTANATTTPVSNLKLDRKSSVWRSATSSTTAVKAIIIVTSSVAIPVSACILAFTNLTTACTIRLRGTTGTAPTMGGTVDAPTVSLTGATTVFDTGIVSGAPNTYASGFSWGTNSIGKNPYTDNKDYVRVWNSTIVNATSFIIEITDTNSDRFVQVSRLILGNHWSPTYNTSYGLSAGIKDTSTNTRSESGDLVTTESISYKVMSFDLRYLNSRDREEFLNLLKLAGSRKPVFVSLFPQNTEDWDKEQGHQIYGKLIQLSDITHSIFGFYSTKIDIEEV